MNRTRITRLVAALLALLILSVCLFSAFEAEHCCTGEGCRICAALHRIASVTENGLIALMFSAAACAFACQAALVAAVIQEPLNTLVSSHCKLSE